MSVSVPTAGELTKRVTFFTRVDLPNSETYAATAQDTDIITVWAKIEPVGDAVYWGTAQTSERPTHRFWVRTIKGKTDSYSLTHGVLVRDVQTKRVYRIYKPSQIQGEVFFTMFEGTELGLDAPEGKPLMDEVLDG